MQAVELARDIGTGVANDHRHDGAIGGHRARCGRRHAADCEGVVVADLRQRGRAGGKLRRRNRKGGRRSGLRDAGELSAQRVERVQARGNMGAAVRHRNGGHMGPPCHRRGIGRQHVANADGVVAGDLVQHA